MHIRSTHIPNNLSSINSLLVPLQPLPLSDPAPLRIWQRDQALKHLRRALADRVRVVDHVEVFFAVRTAVLNEFLKRECQRAAKLIVTRWHEFYERSWMETGRERGRTWYGWTTEQTKQARRWRHWFEGTKLDTDIFAGFWRRWCEILMRLGQNWGLKS